MSEKEKPIRLGKIKNGKVTGMSWNSTWFLNRNIAIIVRDYLRYYISVTPAIGNCVFSEDELYSVTYDGFGKDKITDKKWDEWKALVNCVAKDFDVLSTAFDKFCDERLPDAELNKLAEKAFNGMQKIFIDLEY